MNMKAFIYEAKEGGYWAKVPALPGCFAEGETLDEVKRHIREAVEDYLSVAAEMATEEDGRIVEEVTV